MTLTLLFAPLLAAVVGSAAWLFQRAWERQESRVARYQEIMDRIDAFTVEGHDPQRINELLQEGRRLWLFAPDAVILKFERLVDVIEGVAAVSHPQTDSFSVAVGELVLEIRRDATFLAALKPNFFRTKLTPDRFRIRSARAGR